MFNSHIKNDQTIKTKSWKSRSEPLKYVKNWPNSLVRRCCVACGMENYWLPEMPNEDERKIETAAISFGLGHYQFGILKFIMLYLDFYLGAQWRANRSGTRYSYLHLPIAMWPHAWTPNSVERILPVRLCLIAIRTTHTREPDEHILYLHTTEVFHLLTILSPPRIIIYFFFFVVVVVASLRAYFSDPSMYGWFEVWAQMRNLNKIKIKQITTCTNIRIILNSIFLFSSSSSRIRFEYANWRDGK